MSGKEIFKVKLSLDQITEMVAALHKYGEVPHIREFDGEQYGCSVVDIKAVVDIPDTYSLTVRCYGLLN